MENTCDFCKKVFNRKVISTKYSHLFCSINCFKQFRIENKVTLICKHCGDSFTRERGLYERALKYGNGSYFCTTRCATKFKILSPIECLYCKKQFKPSTKARKFCSRSCAASHRNAHPTVITRVSKLELYIKNKIVNKYSFKILFNDRETLGLELDIFIPALHLAFELNGIVHYKPIYGDKTLSRMQKNDQLKQNKCIEKNIVLHTLNVSDQLYFTEATALPYLTRIYNIIDKCATQDSNLKPHI